MPIRLPEGNAKEKRKKMVLKEGRIVALILILCSFALYWWYSKMIEEGKVFKIRTLPPLEAIPEAVGRCAVRRERSSRSGRYRRWRPYPKPSEDARRWAGQCSIAQESLHH